MISLQRRPDIVRIVVLVCLMLAVTPMMASGRDGARHKTVQPIYLEIVPVASDTAAVIPVDDVARMAQESLAQVGQAVLRADNGDALPAGVRVLRIMYIVHDQSAATGTTLSASASTVLMRTAVDKHRHLRMNSIYSGLQQTLVQGPDKTTAVDKLRDHFGQELRARIASAFDAGSG